MTSGLVPCLKEDPGDLVRTEVRGGATGGTIGVVIGGAAGVCLVVGGGVNEVCLEVDEELVSWFRTGGRGLGALRLIFLSGKGGGRSSDDTDGVIGIW